MLNKNNPLDKAILDLVKKGKLKVGVVKVKEEPSIYSENYSYQEPIENIWKKSIKFNNKLDANFLYNLLCWFLLYAIALIILLPAIASLRIVLKFALFLCRFFVE